MPPNLFRRIVTITLDWRTVSLVIYTQHKTASAHLSCRRLKTSATCANKSMGFRGFLMDSACSHFTANRNATKQFRRRFNRTSRKKFPKKKKSLKELPFRRIPELNAKRGQFKNFVARRNENATRKSVFRFSKD